MSRPHKFRILALGSPHGDDRVGWRVAEMLRSDPQLVGCVHRLASPWEIVEHVAEDVQLVLIDACRSGEPPGTVHRIELQAASDPVAGRNEPRPASEPPAARVLAERRASTHGGGVGEALQLARSLGRRPATAVLFAIESEGCRPAAELSESARTAALRAAELIKREAASLSTAGPIG